MVAEVQSYAPPEGGGRPPQSLTPTLSLSLSLSP